MDKEYALALLLSSYTVNDLLRKRIEHILKKPVNWYKVLDIALQWNTHFLIYRNMLENHYLWMLPSNIKLFWDEAYYGNIKRNNALIKYGKRISKYLLTNNIEVYPIKGVWLSKTLPVYLYVRPMQDIDYIVSPDNLTKITKLLKRKNLFPLYQNDEDYLIKNRPPQSNEFSVLFSKKTLRHNLQFLQIDFCYALTSKVAFEFILKGLSLPGSSEYYISHLLLLYILVSDVLSKINLEEHILDFKLSRLVDIVALENYCNKLSIPKSFDHVLDELKLKKTVREIRNFVEVIWEGVPHIWLH